jgi:bifunctional DNA-binding transcriptional regulator/antitoxin component of YhaV-PrlF toxin-antitoxin module
MHVVSITAKRQATLPAALCKELGLGPGTKLAVERRRVGKETVWVLKGPGPDWSWVGSLRRYARGKSHRLRDIRRSIARGWASGHRA